MKKTALILSVTLLSGSSENNSSDIKTKNNLLNLPKRKNFKEFTVGAVGNNVRNEIR